MAKEVIPPDPIPIILEKDDNDSNDIPLYNKNTEGYSDSSRDLLSYLESEYDNIGTGDTRTFIAHETTKEKVYNEIINKYIKNINKDSFNKHIMLAENGPDVLIFTVLY